MLVDVLEPNFDSCYNSLINNDECKEFYARVNKKAKELNCKIAYNFCRSAYFIGNEEKAEKELYARAELEQMLKKKGL